MIFNWLKNKLRRSKEPKALVLMYHRVCLLDSDPWQLAVSPSNFENQIKTITQSFNVLPISDLIQQYKNKQIEPNSLYITFDDTYQDNYLYAKPILEKYNCPATFFVPTHFIGKEQMFWWDELETILLHSQTLPDKLNLRIGDQLYNFEIHVEALTDDVKAQQKAWYWPSPPPTYRCELYLEIWTLLRPLPYNQIMDVLEILKKWANFEPPQVVENFPMTAEQLENLSNNKLFSLGMHAHTHPALASHSFENQLEEIKNSKFVLTNRNYNTVNALAYPYGNYNEDTISCMKENKIELGFTTNDASITKHSSPFQLGRLQVMDYDGATLIEKITNYLNN